MNLLIVVLVIISALGNPSNYLDELEQSPEEPLREQRPKRSSSLMELGCRGQLKAPSKRSLFCSYNLTTTPFLRLAPFKTEQISLDPFILLFHNAIYDNEISYFTKVRRKDMREAHTDNYTTPNKEYRIMQVKVYEGIGDKMDKTLLERLEDISGLIAGNKSELAAGNYGLGSYFPEHSDYRDIKVSPQLNETGDRLATILFYLSDVEQGGQTIFPLANVTVQPKKGSALFWFNLHNDGEPNIKSLHGVCPIIEGNRWILTTTFFEWDQMFRKPCYK
ncbi:prolyl 4-hydroxylase subunit alpha-2 [Drosophila tropicalis]|uniref:prolyl 4-hydroxylase subunit alpha-2 n=1 Tax=Drosophila tropicalis TaxID=46794 RepID=UPI0035AB773D